MYDYLLNIIIRHLDPRTKQGLKSLYKMVTVAKVVLRMFNRIYKQAGASFLVELVHRGVVH